MAARSEAARRVARVVTGLVCASTQGRRASKRGRQVKQHIGWRPSIAGWSSDILPWYAKQAELLPDGARVVEVGVYHGRSILFLAEALTELGKTACLLYAVDSWAWREEDWEIFAAHRGVTEGGHMIIPVRGRSVDMASRFGGRSDNDLVFIDGEHDYESVSADIAAWRRVVKPGGIMAGHDYVHVGDHAGVGRAVDEAYPAGVTVEDTVWWVRAQ
jgi:predicted O-methyltransferase YrrM